MTSLDGEVARATSPRGDVVLRRRREHDVDVLELRVNGVFVMDTQETSSEIALAAQAVALIADPQRVLIGGLGLGFTLQRVLGDPRVADVTVIEIEESIIEWLRDGTVPYGPALLDDPRVRPVNDDIAVALSGLTDPYDLILLDVDNGPGYLVYDDNEAVYQHDFLNRCRAILAPTGVLVIWSANTAPGLLATLRSIFDNAEEQAHDVLLQDRAESYFLYLACGSVAE